jgi:4-alpha-glucanotransferase
MNLPNSTSGNWLWRFSEDDLTDDLASELRELTNLYGRMLESAETVICD